MPSNSDSDYEDYSKDPEAVTERMRKRFEARASNANDPAMQDPVAYAKRIRDEAFGGTPTTMTTQTADPMVEAERQRQALIESAKKALAPGPNLVAETQMGQAPAAPPRSPELRRAQPVPPPPAPPAPPRLGVSPTGGRVAASDYLSDTPRPPLSNARPVGLPTDVGTSAIGSPGGAAQEDPLTGIWRRVRGGAQKLAHDYSVIDPQVREAMAEEGDPEAIALNRGGRPRQPTEFKYGPDYEGVDQSQTQAQPNPDENPSSTPGSGGVGRFAPYNPGPNPYASKTEQDFRLTQGDREKEAEDVEARAKLGGEAYDKAGAQAKAAANSNIQDADQLKDQASSRMDEIHQLADDYANGHVDPDKWWGDKTLGQKIMTGLGAMFAGLGGGVEGARNFVNDQINRSIALQEDQLNRKEKGAGVETNLLNSFIGAGNNRNEAVTKARLALTESLYQQIAGQLMKATGPVDADRIRQQLHIMAGIHDQAYADAWYAAHQPPSSGPQAGEGDTPLMPINPSGSTGTFTGPDGKTYEFYDPSDKSKVKDKVDAAEAGLHSANAAIAKLDSASSNAISASDVHLTDPTSWYQANPQASAEMREALVDTVEMARANAAVAGGGGRGLGALKILLNKYSVPDKIPENPSIWQLQQWRKAIPAIRAAVVAARDELQAAPLRILQHENVYIGRTVNKRVPGAHGNVENVPHFQGRQLRLESQPNQGETAARQVDTEKAYGAQPRP